MKKAAIMTTNSYPNGDAGAIRQHCMGKMLTALGYEVFVVGYGNYTGYEYKQYDGIKYISLRPANSNKLSRISGRLQFGSKALKCIKENKDGLELILAVDMLPKAFKSIQNYAIKNEIQLVHDSVEWYSPEEFTNGEKSLAYKKKNYLNTVFIDDKWKVIAISSFLNEHFKNRAKASVCIPVILDVENISPRINAIERNKRVFVYAGGPGKKDYLSTIIKGFALLEDKHKKKIEFRIIGVNREKLISMCGVPESVLKETEEFVSILGRVSHEIAVNEVKDADFTFLLRDASLRYAKAGFPTKVVESLSYGTPVICNISSDLGEYLVDEENAVIIDGIQPIDVKNAIEKAVSMSDESYRSMRSNARKLAENSFDYRKHSEVLKKLIGKEIK